jgi:hypothetical protein
MSSTATVLLHIMTVHLIISEDTIAVRPAGRELLQPTQTLAPILFLATLSANH